MFRQGSLRQSAMTLARQIGKAVIEHGTTAYRNNLMFGMLYQGRDGLMRRGISRFTR